MEVSEDVAAEPVAIVDGDHQVSHANEAFAAALGHEGAEALIGTGLEACLPASIAERLRETLFPRARAQGEWTGTVATERGDVRHTMTVRALDPAGFLLRLRPEDDEFELRERLRSYRTIVETVGNPMYVLDGEGYLEMLNQAFSDHLSYPREELLGMHVTSVARDQDFERGTDLLQELLEDPDRQWARYEIELTDATGEARPYENNIAPLVDEDGQFVGSVGVVRDIAERKERARELERSRDLLDQTQRIANVGGWELDPVADELRWTEGMYRLLELDEAYEPTPDRAHSFFIPEDRETVDEAMLEAIKHDEEFDVEVRLETGEGTRKWVRTLGRPTARADGRVTEVRGAMQDITERKERERELREQRRELRRQNDKLDEFASMISHDLRNPLSIAKTYLEFAEESGDPDDFEAVGEALGRMDRMIDELLSFARLGGQLTNRTTLAVDQVARAAWGNLDAGDSTLVIAGPAPTAAAEPQGEPEAGGSGEGAAEGPAVASDGATDPGGWTIAAERERLLSVFENLFRNAIEHNDEPVTVTVGLLDETGDGRPVRQGFYVADDGVGIPADTRERIFEHGFTTDDGGTGFGLSIVETIVEAHGWAVAVTESAAGGARFEVRI